MDGRRSVARSGLTSAAVAALTPMMMNVEFDQLGEVKRLLQQYHRGSSADERVGRVFAVADEVARVMVGPDFVAVTIDHPNRWRELPEPMSVAVAESFGAIDDEKVDVSAPTGGPAGAGAGTV